MEVIVRGVVPPEKKYQGICGNCNSVIRALESELTKPHLALYMFGTCPVCREAMYFETLVKSD